MEEITQALIAITDWFVKEGAEVIYGSGPQLDGDGYLPDLHEARLDDLQVFIGEPANRLHPEVVAEVAVLLRTGIPLPVQVVEGSVTAFSAGLPFGLGIDVIEDPEDGSCAVWLSTIFWEYEIESDRFANRLSELLNLARSPQAVAIREQII